MSTKVLSSAVGVCICSAVIAGMPPASRVIAAQEPAPVGVVQPQDAPKPELSASPKPEANTNKITVQGCVEQARAATGTPGAIGTAGTPAPFILTKAERSSANAGSSSATMTYLLDSDAGKIGPHVGHKVEITGVIQPMAAANTGGRSGSPSTGASNVASTLTIKVDEVKMLAATCTQ